MGSTPAPTDRRRIVQHEKKGRGGKEEKPRVGKREKKTTGGEENIYILVYFL